jgi:hypothetical protein
MTHVTPTLRNGMNMAMAGAMLLLSAGSAFAAPPGAQVFEVYNNTQNGIQSATDPDIGNIEVVANPDSQGRLIINIHLQKGAPNCTYNVELVRDTAALNGGLTTTGHTGSVQVLGALTTNKAGNGNAHFDIPVGDGTLDEETFGHIDIEDYSLTCGITGNQYGAAPDPLLNTPLTWLE